MKKHSMAEIVLPTAIMKTPRSFTYIIACLKLLGLGTEITGNTRKMLVSDFFIHL
jgi:hypothetical protein